MECAGENGVAHFTGEGVKTHVFTQNTMKLSSALVGMIP